MSKVAFLYEVLKSPHLFLRQLKILNEVNKYMRFIVVDSLAPALSKLQIGENVDLGAFMKAEGYVDHQ
ncbi:MAG: hypothetical protein QXF77_10485, partial [Candidatus Jordarchaeales archaeon]